MSREETIRFALGYRAFYGIQYVLYSMHALYSHVEKIVVAITDTPQTFSVLWRYKPEITPEFIKKYPDIGRKIEVIKGSWGPNLIDRNTLKFEARHCNAILDYVRGKNPELNYLIILDTDEILTDESIAGLKKAILMHPEAYAFKMCYKNYWKGLHYVAEGKYHSATVCIKITPDIKFSDVNVREINKKPVIALGENIYYHHLTYALSTKKLLIKIRTFGHANTIRKNWYRDVWKAWDNNKSIANIHPLFDGSWWEKAIRINDSEVPQLLRQHPYFQHETVDDFERAMAARKTQDLWVPR
ncbi:MAG: hypothetical protein V2A72_02590 [Candidatus Omnitrophota bacterium]